MHLIETLVDLNRISEAAPLTQEVLKSNPADPRVLLANSRILIAQHNYKAAMDALQAALKSEPKSAETLYFLGIAENAIGLADLARASLTGALALNPHMAAAAASLANLEVKLGNYDETLRLVNSAVKANPASPLGLRNRRPGLSCKRPDQTGADHARRCTIAGP